MNEVIEIYSCPCCGGEVEIFYGDDDHSIYCKECPCGVTDWTMTLEELIKCWNNRIDINKKISIVINLDDYK